MADKEFKVKVATEPDLKGVEAIENRIQKIKQEQIQLRLNAKTEQLDQANQRIEYLKRTIAGLEAVPPHLGIEVDESEVQALKTELANLEHKTAQLQLDVEKGELEATKSEIEALDGEEIEVQLRNQSAMEALDQIGQGFDRLKQGAGELKEQFGTILESAGKQETNKTFLEMNVGADKAGKALQDINNIVADLPGDDTALQGLLSQAVAKDATLTSDALKSMGTSAADYFSAMSYYGKSATEAQQDMTNYLLAGNTAELERSPILQAHIDKLKEANTPLERSQALYEALNQEGWAGMSNQDTYNNKLETFNGMLERGRYNLGGMFQEGAKQGMDFLLKLDEASGGLVGMSFALMEMASPITDTVMGLGQIAMGMNAIKDLGFIKYLKDLEIMSKLSAAATWLQNTALWGMIAPILANPITWLVIALIALAVALVWAYQNVDWFREMVDNAWASIQQFAGTIWNSLTGAIQWVSDLFNQFTSQIGLNSQNWIQSILGFILFIPTLPLQVGIALANAIAHALGFGSNFVQRLITAGSNAVNGFINYIRQIPTMVYQEFQRTLQLVNDFINDIPNKVWDMGVAIIDALKSALGIGSPGHMFYMIEGEFNRIDDLTKKTRFDTSSIGQQMVDNFNPNLQTSNQGIVQSGAGGNNITINIDNVDNEERIQQIVKAVEDALAWDNLTAGRTV